MREKELRLALICYGGISLAVYMHGVTKEVWRLAQASREWLSSQNHNPENSNHYTALLTCIQKYCNVRIRVLPDVIAGASAGGINGIFLAQAIATGQSLEPLTQLWLDNADIDKLLDPDARPDSALSKIWAAPIAWAAFRRRDDARRDSDSAVETEIRTKLSNFVRSRWFEPPFGGTGFSTMILDAFDAMAAQPAGPRLLPNRQPLDLFVTVTDFHGYATRLKLNTPLDARENEHRLTIAFRDTGAGLGDSAGLTFAARATASFPGAFPPFNVAELDSVLTTRNRQWPERAGFLTRALVGQPKPEEAILIDGSVLANAPFHPAIAALPNRPARREVDRRFVYIDPKPGRRSVMLGRNGKTQLPSFLGTIFGAMSDIPREQPIRDSLDAIEERSSRIRRMQKIVEAIRPAAEAAIEQLFGRTFFLDKPTPKRLNNWRDKAQIGATREAGFFYSSYAHMKLSGIVEELAQTVARQEPVLTGSSYDQLRQSIWAEVRARGADQVWMPQAKAAGEAAITFFRAHDLNFRIRRMRFVLRTLSNLIASKELDPMAVEPLRSALFKLLATYLDRQGTDFFEPLPRDNAGDLLNAIAARRGLSELDRATDEALAEAFGACPKEERRIVLFAYLGFPYFDISTLPLLHGEGLDEFDPIKVDRISPDDALAIRSGGVDATLKGIEFNSFGAFFSRTYRENDYLWGRLHGADRLFDIILSSAPDPESIPADEIRVMKRNLLLSILDEEQLKLTKIRGLCATIRREIAAGPLAD
jgi:patatin-related protein